MDSISPKTDYGFHVFSHMSYSPNCMFYHAPKHYQPMVSVSPLSVLMVLQPAGPTVPLFPYTTALPIPLKILNVPQKTVLGSSSFS